VSDYKFANADVKREETITPVDDTTIVINNDGVTYINGGITLGTDVCVLTLPDGDYIGQIKVVECLGTLTTNGAVVTPTTGGLIAARSGALSTITFDAADEVAILEWNGGAWDVKYSTGATVA